jgi:hypothetical protein
MEVAVSSYPKTKNSIEGPKINFRMPEFPPIPSVLDNVRSEKTDSK